MKLIDEITLSEITIKVYSFLIRKLIFLSVSVVIGITIGIFMYLNSKPYYGTSIIGTTNITANHRIVDITNTLGILIEEQNYLEVSKNMGIPLKTAQQIKSINASAIPVEKEELVLLEVLESTTTNNGVNSFKIEMETFNYSTIQDLNNGFIFYFDSNPYLTERLEVKKLYYFNLIKKLEIEIIEQDELQKMISNTISKRSEGLVLNPSSSASMENLILLYQKKESLIRDSKLLANVKIIQRAYNTQKSKINASITIGAYSFIFLILGLIASILIEVHKLTKAVNQLKD